MEATQELIELSKLNCLYVDQYKDSQILFNVQHNKIFKSIMFADSFIEAVAFINTKIFDIIFIELYIQDVDCIEAMKLIRANSLNTNALIIATSAFGSSEDKNRCLSVGFDGFIYKPLFANKTVELLSNICLKEREAKIFDPVMIVLPECQKEIFDNYRKSTRLISDLTCLYIEVLFGAQRLLKKEMDFKKIVFARSLGEAIQWLEYDKFDLIIVDLQTVWEINAIDIIKRSKNATTPLIAVSPPLNSYLYAKKTDKTSLIIQYPNKRIRDFDAFITKPISKNKVANILEWIFK